MSVTLTNVKTYITDRAAGDGSTRFDRVMTKIANDALTAIYQAGDFDFAKRWVKQALAAPYTTGTASISVDGTALTGSGTTWTSAMEGRYIRLNGEAALYRLVTYVSATAFTIETYRGDATLSAEDYEILDIRFAAPSRFRSFGRPQADDQSYSALTPVTLERVKQMHMHERLQRPPSVYATEQVEVSSVPTPYIWVYPAPAAKQILELPYYVWPAEKTSGSDVFELPFEAQDLLWAFVDAFLAKYHKAADWPALLAKAEDDARKKLGRTRAINEGTQSTEMRVEGGDETIFGGDWGLASGEPVYT